MWGKNPFSKGTHPCGVGIVTMASEKKRVAQENFTARFALFYDLSLDLVCFGHKKTLPTFGRAD